MQHGTGREVVAEAIENALAVLTHRGLSDVVAALDYALDALEDGTDLDEPGVYGPDYPSHERTDNGFYIPRVTKAERSRAIRIAGSIRDTRPEGLGR